MIERRGLKNGILIELDKQIRDGNLEETFTLANEIETVRSKMCLFDISLPNSLIRLIVSSKSFLKYSFLDFGLFLNKTQLRNNELVTVRAQVKDNRYIPSSKIS